jgi:hypothetical protein
VDRGPDAPRIAHAEHGGRGVHRAITALAAFAVIILVGVSAWAFAPSQADAIRPPDNLAELPYVDGVMIEVDPPRLVLDAYTPIDGQREVEFRVRDEDLKYFDVVHLRAHSSIGLPTRVYYERDEDGLWAVYKEDAPANNADEGGE